MSCNYLHTVVDYLCDTRFGHNEVKCYNVMPLRFPNRGDVDEGSETYTVYKAYNQHSLHSIQVLTTCDKM